MPYLLVPSGSSVKMNCTAVTEWNINPLWGIDLASDTGSFQHQFSSGKDVLNDDGVYELTQVNTRTHVTSRLLINNTSSNNGTQINCRTNSVFTTTIMVFGKCNTRVYPCYFIE